MGMRAVQTNQFHRRKHMLRQFKDQMSGLRPRSSSRIACVAPKVINLRHKKTDARWVRIQRISYHFEIVIAVILFVIQFVIFLVWARNLAPSGI